MCESPSKPLKATADGGGGDRMPADGAPSSTCPPSPPPSTEALTDPVASASPSAGAATPTTAPAATTAAARRTTPATPPMADRCRLSPGRGDDDDDGVDRLASLPSSPQAVAAAAAAASSQPPAAPFYHTWPASCAEAVPDSHSNIDIDNHHHHRHRSNTNNSSTTHDNRNHNNNGGAAADDEDDEVVQLATSPPDGGWGWVVVFSSFMVHVLADGFTYSFGIFHFEFVDYFHESHGRTSWVASILVSTTFLCGPLASALTNVYGCRTVTIAGAVLASTGLLVSAWAPNVTCLFFSIGVVTGLGLGLMYLPAIVSVAMYFERRRALATGIAVCGSGCGTFVLAPVLEFLVHYYGWRGALIITAGMLLQCAVFGALMRPPEYEVELVMVKDDREASAAATTAVAANAVATSVEPAAATLLGDDSDINMTYFANENFAPASHQQQHYVPCKDVKDPAPEIRDILELEAVGHLLKPGDALGGTHRLGGSRDKLHHKSICHLSMNSEPELVLIRTPSIDRQLYLEREGISFTQSSYASLRKRLSYTSQPSLSAHSVQVRDQRSTHEKFASFVKTIADSIDLALLLRSPVFILFALSNFFTSIGFNVPYVYIKDVARRKLAVGDSQASLLLSMIGFSNTASRVLLGYLSDKKFVNRIWLYNACIGTCGLATALSVFCRDYVELSLYCLTFGATSGAFISLTSVILVDLLGLERLNNAFGLVLMFEGVACLIGPPLAGSLYDWTTSYDWGFVFSGVVIALGGVMLCLIPCVRPERPQSAASSSGGGGNNNKNANNNNSTNSRSANNKTETAIA